MSDYSFKLFVTGNTPRSERAIANLRRLCEEELGQEYEMIIIDVLEQPEAAESDKVLTTPTLVKVAPPPSRRITGDLEDARRVLFLLALGEIGRNASRNENP